MRLTFSHGVQSRIARTRMTWTSLEWKRPTDEQTKLTPQPRHGDRRRSNNNNTSSSSSRKYEKQSKRQPSNPSISAQREIPPRHCCCELTVHRLVCSSSLPLDHVLSDAPIAVVEPCFITVCADSPTGWIQPWQWISSSDGVCWCGSTICAVSTATNERIR